MHIKTIQLFLFILLSFGFKSLNAQKSLTINISNVQDNVGKIHLALFRPNDNFPFEGGACKEFSTAAVKGVTTYKINDLPKGEYAIAIYHDEDQSGKCETNFIGYPKEGYCFSKNFKVFLSAPPFSKCSINLDSDKAIAIGMRY